MEKENEEVGTGVTTENAGAAEATETKKSLMDYLNEDKELQSQYDRKVSDALKTARTKWEEEQQNKKAESERFAKLSEDEKNKELLEKEKSRADKAEKDLNAYKLENETIRQANERGIPLDLVQTLDFNTETAESIYNKLAIFEKTYKSEREKAIKEYSGETPPQTGERVQTKDFSSMTYDEIAEYLEKHPDAKI